MALSAHPRRLGLRVVLAIVVSTAALAGGAPSASAEGEAAAVLERVAGTLGHATGAVLASQSATAPESSERAPQQSSEAGDPELSSSTHPETPGPAPEGRTGASASKHEEGSHGASPRLAARRESTLEEAARTPGRSSKPLPAAAGGGLVAHTPGPVQGVSGAVSAAAAPAGRAAGRGLLLASAAAARAVLGGADVPSGPAGGLLEEAGGLLGPLLVPPASAAAGEPTALPVEDFSPRLAEMAGKAPGAPGDATVRAAALPLDDAVEVESRSGSVTAVAPAEEPVPGSGRDAADEAVAEGAGTSGPASPPGPGPGSIPAAAGALAVGAVASAVALLALLALSPPGSRRRPRALDRLGSADAFALLLCRPD